MTIKHLFGREDTYVILTDYKQRDGEDGRGPHGKAVLAERVRITAALRPSDGA